MRLAAEPAPAARRRLMAHQIALLLPHLGGKAYSLRSAIVHAIGSLLHKAFDGWAGGAGMVVGLAYVCFLLPAACGRACSAQPRSAPPRLPWLAPCSSAVTDAADAQGAQARLRSKQLLLDMLCERIRHGWAVAPLRRAQHWGAAAGPLAGASPRLASPGAAAPACVAACRDQSSYTRVAVLQTWEYLAEHRAVPLGHWQMVTNIAVGAWTGGRIGDGALLMWACGGGGGNCSAQHRIARHRCAPLRGPTPAPPPLQAGWRTSRVWCARRRCAWCRR